MVMLFANLDGKSLWEMWTSYIPAQYPFAAMDVIMENAKHQIFVLVILDGMEEIVQIV